MRALTNLLPILALTTIVSGCSTSFFYNRLDSLITWYVDDYVDLTYNQKQQLQQALQPVLDWHRQEELQKNIRLLQTIRNDVEQPVAVETVTQWTGEMLQSFRRVQLNLVDVALEFGNTLSDQQMQEFIDSVREKQQERRQEYLSRTDAEYIEDSYDRLESRLSKYLGNLNEAQQASLAQSLTGLQRLDRIWLEDSENWLDKIQPYLRREPGWQSAIRALFDNRESYRSPQYQRVFAHNLHVVNTAVTRVLNLRNDRQQKVLMAELDEFKTALLTLTSYSERSDSLKSPQSL